MSRKGKRKDEDEYGGDRDEASHPKKAPRSDSEDSDSITICDISKNRRVSVRSWQGKVVVDIREFYMKDGRVLPGKKGISLSMDQVTQMVDQQGPETPKRIAEKTWEPICESRHNASFVDANWVIAHYERIKDREQRC